MANPGMQSQPIPTLLVVEDGDEYLEFFERNMRGYRLLQAKSASQAHKALGRAAVDVIVMDIRFDRIDRDALIGDVLAISRKRFGQDTDLSQAWRYLADRQGFLIVDELRKQGRKEPILFIEQLPPRQVANLEKLYGPVAVVPEFDAVEIHRMLLALMKPR